jgi:hypothetical protein
MKKILLSLLLVGSTMLPARALQLPVPERLVYDLTYTGIKAGTAVQETTRDRNGAMHITSTARSADWVTVFYPVEDRIDSFLAPKSDGIGLPEKFTMKIREGSRRKDRVIAFDRGAAHANWTDNINKVTREIKVSAAVADTLSGIYMVREMKLEPGKPVRFDMIDDDSFYNVEVEVLRREKLDTIFGEIDTIVVHPRLKSEGLFLRKGEIHIWLTDDERHIPVKMKSKVKIGSINATLVEATVQGVRVPAGKK